MHIQDVKKLRLRNNNLQPRGYFCRAPWFDCECTNTCTNLHHPQQNPASVRALSPVHCSSHPRSTQQLSRRRRLPDGPLHTFHAPTLLLADRLCLVAPTPRTLFPTNQLFQSISGCSSLLQSLRTLLLCNVGLTDLSLPGMRNSPASLHTHTHAHKHYTSNKASKANSSRPKQIVHTSTVQSAPAPVFHPNRVSPQPKEVVLLPNCA